MSDSSARRSILSLFLVQILAKALNFGLNTLIVASTGKKLFGVGAVPLALLLSTVQFLSREGIRCACRRIDLRSDPKELAAMVLLSWIPVLLAGFVIGPVSVGVLTYFGYEGVSSDDFNSVAIWFAIASGIELLAEPAFNVILAYSRLYVKAGVEAVGVSLKGIVIYAGVVWLGAGPEIYALAQLVYSGAILAGYYGYIAIFGLPGLTKAGDMGKLLPKFNTTIDYRSRWEALIMSLNSILKYVLTEGDKWILYLAKNKINKNINKMSAAMATATATTANLSEMDAVYGVVFNLGSLLVRIVLEPVETQSRVQFSKLSSHYYKHSNDPSNQNIQKTYISEYCSILGSFSFRLRILSTVCAIVMCLGPSYTWLLLRILYKDKYIDTQAPLVLAWYCLYVFLLSVNGMIEALRDSVSDVKQLSSKSPTGLTGFMVVTFTFCSILAYVLVPKYGALGIVYSNSMNLILRILFSLHFIAFRGVYPPIIDRFETAKSAFRNSVPKRTVLMSLFGSGVIAYYASPTDPSAASLATHVIHVIIGALCGVCIVIASLVSDEELREETFEAFGHSRVFKLLRVSGIIVLLKIVGIKIVEQGPGSKKRK